MSALNFAAYDLDWLPDFGPCPGEAGPGDADAGAAHPWQVPHALPPASWAPAQAGGMMVGYPAPYAAGQPRAAPLPAHAGAARATLAAAAPARAVPPPPPPRAALAAVTPTPGGKCLDPGHCSPCSRCAHVLQRAYVWQGGSLGAPRAALWTPPIDGSTTQP